MVKVENVSGSGSEDMIGTGSRKLRRTGNNGRDRGGRVAAARTAVRVRARAK